MYIDWLSTWDYHIILLGVSKLLFDTFQVFPFIAFSSVLVAKKARQVTFILRGNELPVHKQKTDSPLEICMKNKCHGVIRREKTQNLQKKSLLGGQS